MSALVGSIQLAVKTAAAWTLANQVLLVGQVGCESDLLPAAPKYKVGDGVTAWNSLPYSNAKDTVLTGFVIDTSNTGVEPTDTILEAIQKLQGQINNAIG